MFLFDPPCHHISPSEAFAYDGTLTLGTPAGGANGEGQTGPHLTDEQWELLAAAAVAPSPEDKGQDAETLGGDVDWAAYLENEYASWMMTE